MTEPTEIETAGNQAWTRAAVWIAIVLTAIILGMAAAQLAQHGDWPPFNTKSDGVSLGETGDFFGGWANSLALVWLIVVTLLQYSALQVQRAEMKLSREELRLSREELKETRDEIKKQAKAATEQAEHSAAILALERERLVSENMARDRATLKSTFLEAIWHRNGRDPNASLEYGSIYDLISDLSGLINKMLEDKSPIAGRQGEFRRFANHARSITDFFDGMDQPSHTERELSGRSGMRSLMNQAHLYHRCKALQELAASLDA